MVIGSAYTLSTTNTYWTRTSNDMKTNFKTVETRTKQEDDNIYYELLCNNGESKYWLASRVLTHAMHGPIYSNYGNLYTYTIFGLSDVYNGGISYGSLHGSNSDHYYAPKYSARTRFVRPVVTLSADVLNMNAGNGSSESPWGVK